MASKHRSIDGELLRRWSLFLSWRLGDNPPDEWMTRAEEACVRGEEPPDDGWAEEMARSEEEAFGWADDEEDR